MASSSLAQTAFDGFQGVVLEDLLADLVPDVLLRIEFRRVGREEQQRDIVWEHEVTGTVVGSAVEHQENVGPGELPRQATEEYLEAFSVRGRHDQIGARPVPGADRTVQVDVLAHELGSDRGSDLGRRPAWPGPVDPAEPRLVGEHDPQGTTPSRRRPRGASHAACKAPFLNAFCAANPLGMIRTGISLPRLNSSRRSLPPVARRSGAREPAW